MNLILSDKRRLMEKEYNTREFYLQEFLLQAILTYGEIRKKNVSLKDCSQDPLERGMRGVSGVEVLVYLVCGLDYKNYSSVKIYVQLSRYTVKICPF